MVVGNHLLPTSTVVIAKIDKVQLGVGKIHSFGRNVEGQTIGPINLGRNDGLP